MIKPSDLGIIADDLTGACDAAACFTAAQGVIEVFIDPNHAHISRIKLTVLNTQSRLKSVGECRALMREVAKFVKDRHIIFKKIDTAFRGPVGAELEALSGALGIKRIVVAPAIPRIGRTTRGGVQYDRGIPIHRTPYSKDPASPVDSANVLELIHKTGEVQCEVMDAETDLDLKRVVEEGIRESKILFVGSLGLADALAERVEKRETQRENFPSAIRVLIVCGSRYEQSRVQIENAAIRYNAKPIEVVPPFKGGAELRGFNRSGIAILCLSPGNGPPEDAAAPGLLSGFTESILDFMKASRPDALGMVGGETSYHLLHALNAGVLRVFGRISEVMPFGAIADGDLRGCLFATKGGSVGTDDSIAEMIRYFKGER
jgi:uncharacterized protein YgbK (DUF1537 family)